MFFLFIATSGKVFVSTDPNFFTNNAGTGGLTNGLTLAQSFSFGTLDVASQLLTTISGSAGAYASTAYTGNPALTNGYNNGSSAGYSNNANWGPSPTVC